jgi:four helix bundle protein
VPENIADGFKRKGKAYNSRIVKMSQRSIEEVRYCLILANDPGHSETEKPMIDLDEISRIRNTYMNSFED